MFSNISLAQGQLRKRLLFLIAGSLLVSFAVFILIAYLGLKANLYEQLESKVEHVQHLSRVLLEQRIEILESDMKPVLVDPRLSQAFLARDREKLLALSTDLFEHLRETHNISHYYYHLIDGTNFLRVHKPERHGDTIDRYTLVRTAQTLEQHAGLELGPFGTFTLRVVSPWYYEGELIGFIEFGEEFQPILVEAALDDGVDIVVMIEKRFLDREDWQAGMQMLAREGDWALFSDLVVVDETRFGLARLLHQKLPDSQLLPVRVELETADEAFIGRELPLLDVTGATVGRWYIMNNITESMTTFRHSMMMLLVLCLSIGFLLITIFNRVLKNIETHLRDVHEGLEQLVDERTRELQQALSEVEVNREQIRVVLKSLKDPILVADESNRVWLANRAARELFRLGDENLNAYTFAELLDSELVSQLGSMSPVDHESIEVVIEQLEAGRPRPSTFLVQTTSVALGEGQQANIFVFHNVTRARKLERLKSEFISNAAHELNTPLATILGYSELLLDAEQDFNPETREEFLHTIYQKANHLNNLLGQILDISRLEAGRPIPLEIENIPLQQRVEKMFRHLPVIHPRHDFKVELPEVPAMVSADPGKFTQIMENLISNAVKYSPGGGTITLRVTEDEASGQLHFMVKDQGVGMSSEELSQAFERFYRVDASDSATRGVGLGLTITRQLVESHEGRIWLESQPGEGTEVHFTLPGFLVQDAKGSVAR